MKRQITPWFFILLILSLIGCTGRLTERVVDLPKTVWGSSTRALEGARTTAISKTLKCSLDECFNAVLEIGEVWSKPLEIGEERPNTVLTGAPAPDSHAKEAIDPDPLEQDLEEGALIAKKSPFSIFFHDRAKQHIVVIGVPGSVDSTEVGIFFDTVDDGVKIDIASLSSNAKRSVARTLFPELEAKLAEAGQ